MAREGPRWQGGLPCCMCGACSVVATAVGPRVLRRLIIFTSSSPASSQPQEYDFNADSRNPTLPIDLKPNVQVGGRVCVGGRLRSGRWRVKDGVLHVEAASVV